MTEKVIKIGVCVTIINDGKLLLGKRKNVAGEGMWGLPGGHLEYGESLRAAASRELKEETNLISNNLEFLQIVNDPREDKHYIHINFIAKDIQGELKNMEPEKCYEWKWFNLSDLPDGIFFGHIKIINGVLNNLKFVD